MHKITIELTSKEVKNLKAGMILDDNLKDDLIFIESNDVSTYCKEIILNHCDYFIYSINRIERDYDEIINQSYRKFVNKKTEEQYIYEEKIREELTLKNKQIEELEKQNKQTKKQLKKTKKEINALKKNKWIKKYKI
jgi:hypothetical protein